MDEGGVTVGSSWCLFVPVPIPIFAILIYVVLATGIFPLNDVGLLYLVARAYGKTPQIIKVTERESDGVTDATLPTITILVPLYKERKTLPYLTKALVSSNYPREKLDIHFLVEHDDLETISAILALPSLGDQVHGIEYDFYGIPKQVRSWDGTPIELDFVYDGPRTKPNALNVGLKNARGEILTIFDAEDRPDPHELRKVAVYMHLHPEIAVVQARLSYYNQAQSILTRYFSIEYIQHFLVILPELFSMKNVIPLGGTSNFFRVEVLRDVGGWDPLNGTEDADLGVRISRLGYKIAPINVITWEEAPPRVMPWLRQRVRWNKGFLYTLVAHFRHPRKLIKDIGLTSTFFLFLLLAYPLMSAVSLVGWGLFAVYWLDWFGFTLQPFAGWIHDAFAFNPVVFYASVLTFTFGIFYSTFVALEGLFRQGDDHALRLVKFSLFTPAYMMLHGVASALAIVELVSRPTVWHKTPHGFSIQDSNEPPKS